VSFDATDFTPLDAITGAAAVAGVEGAATGNAALVLLVETLAAVVVCGSHDVGVCMT